MTFMQQILNKIMMKIFKKKIILCNKETNDVFIQQKSNKIMMKIFKKKSSPVTRKKRCHLYNKNRTK